MILNLLSPETETLDSHRYLGALLNDRLHWRTNNDAVYKKDISRIYFLRRLRSVTRFSKILDIFCQSVVANPIYFAAVGWGEWRCLSH